MAGNSERSLSGGTRRLELSLGALALSVGLAAGSVAAESDRDLAFRATLDQNWTQAAALWAKVDGPRARQYRQQAETELRLQQARAFVDKAGAARKQEDWAAADAAYQKALGIARHLRAAIHGREQVAPYIEAHRQLAALKVSEGLFDRVLRARAKEWLAFVDKRKLSDRKIAHARQQVVDAIQLAQVKVPLTLTSDNTSKIEIYGVGALGQIDRQVLELLPGDYIAVASRPGFRDVRATLNVRPGKRLTIDLRCTEPVP